MRTSAAASSVSTSIKNDDVSVYFVAQLIKHSLSLFDNGNEGFFPKQVFQQVEVNLLTTPCRLLPSSTLLTTSSKYCSSYGVSWFCLGCPRLICVLSKRDLGNKWTKTGFCIFCRCPKTNPTRIDRPTNFYDNGGAVRSLSHVPYTFTKKGNTAQLKCIGPYRNNQPNFWDQMYPAHQQIREEYKQ